MIDQALRRILAALRDWSPLLGRSQEGEEALLLLSRIRVQLMEVQACFASDGSLQDEKVPEVTTALDGLRGQLRVLALVFEMSWSGARRARPEVIPSSFALRTQPEFAGAEREVRRTLRSAAGEMWKDPLIIDTVGRAQWFVVHAHAQQVDKMGRDYYLAHLLPVAARLQQRGSEAEMAGLLHDVIEDTPFDIEWLERLKIPAPVCRAVVSVTRLSGEEYEDFIRRAKEDPLGREVKLADNAVNLANNADLAELRSDKAAELRHKYERARRILEAEDD